MTQDLIKEEIREYIKKSIIKNDTIAIADDTKLISGGLIDSISTLQMVSHLKNKYKIEFQPHEVDRENLDTLDLITQFVSSKL